MEDSRERSIRLIIERAKQDKEDMIKYIDSIITYKLPEITNNSGRVSTLFTDLASDLDISFSPDEQIRDLIALYTEKLIALKQDLEKLEITEETLMGNESVLIKQAQDVIELLEPALEKAKNNFYNTNKNAFLKSYKQREETRVANIEETRISIEEIRTSIMEKQAQITELKIQKAYIQGQLDITKRKKKRAELQKRIEEIDAEIQNYEGEILQLETQEKEISNPQDSKTETKVVEPMDNQIGEETQIEGGEQDDGVNR